MPTAAIDPSTLTPPRPGAWELEQTHLTAPPSGFIAPIFPVAMPKGFGAGLRDYGTLLEPFDIAIIGGFIYMCPRAVGAPLDAEGLPPRIVFEVMRRLHPEMRRRVARARTVFAEKRWRQDVASWDNEVKPALLREAAALRAEDLDRLNDAQLANHVRRAAAFLARGIESHHRFNVCALMPVGDFLVHATAWTGLTPSALLEACRGLSAPSAGATPEMTRLVAALADDPDGTALLLSSAPAASIVEGLLAREGAVGEAMRAYLDVVGFRCLGGYDVSEKHVRENPELLVRIIRAARQRPAAGADGAGTSRALAAARERVPPEHRPAFDALFEEVRVTYRIRDERNFFGDAPAIGLARRAILEAGRRLAARGALEAADHAIDATADELAEMLTGGDGPTAGEVAARYRFRVEANINAMPPNLGLRPSPPPPASWFPGDAARVARAIGMAMDLMFGVHAAAPAAKVLKGFPASPGVYEGPVRVVRTAAELPTVEAGDVLVTPATSPTFNAVLPLVGAIVTERGGALCHAAIVAREYGLPAVVGSMHILKTVRTGMRVRVDGAAGEVTLLD
ncbi:MAG: PEP-utilizing enzyme [Vicinamibacterales bacterium]